MAMLRATAPLPMPLRHYMRPAAFSLYFRHTLLCHTRCCRRHASAAADMLISPRFFMIIYAAFHCCCFSC